MHVSNIRQQILIALLPKVILTDSIVLRVIHHEYFPPALRPLRPCCVVTARAVVRVESIDEAQVVRMLQLLRIRVPQIVEPVDNVRGVKGAQDWGSIEVSGQIRPRRPTPIQQIVVQGPPSLQGE